MVTNVTYECARGGESYYKYRWGKLRIYIYGALYEYDFLKEVAEAQNRLMFLCMQNKENSETKGD